MVITIKISRLLVAFVFLIASAQANSTTPFRSQIIRNGPADRKYDIAVIGDGFAAHEISDFESRINGLLINGLLGNNDFFGDNRNRFNLYKVVAISNNSGISTPSQPIDTAVGAIYVGGEYHYDLSESTITKLNDRVDSLVAGIPVDQVVILTNDNNGAGLRVGRNIFVSKSVSWHVLAHELGHGIGDLYDEYWYDDGQNFIGSPKKGLNCAKAPTPDRVPWSSMISNGVTLPFPYEDSLDDSSVPEDTIWAFRGCGKAGANIYRASPACRMRTPQKAFCGYCRSVLERSLAKYSNEIIPMTADESNLADRFLYVSITLRADSESTVDRVVELKTDSISERSSGSFNEIGSYIYEVTQGKNVIAVGAFPEDPFVVKSLPVDTQTGIAESSTRTKQVSVSVEIPSLGLTNLKQSDLSVRFYRLEKELISAQKEVSVENFKVIKAQNKLSKTTTVSSKQFNLLTISP